MREFNSLQAFAAHLVMMQTAEIAAIERGLEAAARAIKKTAKSEIGHYQLAAGPFPGWSLLAASTEADKAAKGYPENAPLLREGDLRDSIEHETHHLEAVIGSKSDIAAYQEFGTNKIPPRPFIGPAAFRNKEKIKKILGSAVVAGLVGGDVIHESLGYDMEV